MLYDMTGKTQFIDFTFSQAYLPFLFSREDEITQNKQFSSLYLSFVKNFQ